MTDQAKVQSTLGGRVAPPAVTSLLREGEQVIRVARISQGIYWKTIFVAILAVVLLLTAFPLGVLLSIVAFFMFSLATLYRHFLLLVLTNSRIFLRHGIIRVDLIQIRHSRVESVETERTIPGMIMGYAAVVIYGTGSRRTAIPFIADALEFRNELDEILNKYDEDMIPDHKSDSKEDK